MLAHQRHDEILRQVNSNGSVRVTDLVTELGVSEMTVRRDISLLANQGKLERVHGGAVRLEGESLPTPASTIAANDEERYWLKRRLKLFVRALNYLLVQVGAVATSLKLLAKVKSSRL